MLNLESLMPSTSLDQSLNNVLIEISGLASLVWKEGQPSAKLLLMHGKRSADVEHVPMLVTFAHMVWNPSSADVAFPVPFLNPRLVGWKLKGRRLWFRGPEKGLTINHDDLPASGAPAYPDDPTHWQSIRWLPSIAELCGSTEYDEPGIFEGRKFDGVVELDRGSLAALMPRNQIARRLRVSFIGRDGTSKGDRLVAGRLLHHLASQSEPRALISDPDIKEPNELNSLVVGFKPGVVLATVTNLPPEFHDLEHRQQHDHLHLAARPVTSLDVTGHFMAFYKLLTDKTDEPRLFISGPFMFEPPDWDHCYSSRWEDGTPES